MAYIKILENNVVIGGEAEPTADMLADGWIEYNGQLFTFNKWDAETGTVVEDIEQVNASKKSIGVPYTLNGVEYLVPLSKEAQDGITAITLAFMNKAIDSTIVEFENGTTMPITAEEWMAFASWFASERNKMFVK